MKGILTMVTRFKSVNDCLQAFLYDGSPLSFTYLWDFTRGNVCQHPDDGQVYLYQTIKIPVDCKIVYSDGAYSIYTKSAFRRRFVDVNWWLWPYVTEAVRNIKNCSDDADRLSLFAPGYIITEHQKIYFDDGVDYEVINKGDYLLQTPITLSGYLVWPKDVYNGNVHYILKKEK